VGWREDNGEMLLNEGLVGCSLKTAVIGISKGRDLLCLDQDFR
jgi:hypothetical protein